MTDYVFSPSRKRAPAKAVSEKKEFTTKTLPPVIDGGGGVTEAGWHKIEAFMRCPKAGQYELRGVRLPQYQTPGHFAKGGALHAMRARWFALRCATDAKSIEAVLDAGRKYVEDEKLPVNPKDLQYAELLIHEYIHYWAMRPRPDPVAVEYKLGPTPIIEGDPDTARTARVDDVSRYPEAGGKLCIGELKTTSDDISGLMRMYELHGQPLLQHVLWHAAPQGWAMHGPSAGMLLDIVKKPYGREKAKFARVFVEIRPGVLSWYRASMAGYLRAYAAMTWDSEAPRNVTGCTYQAGRARVNCQYKDLCRFFTSAAGKYVLADGTSLKSHQPSPGKMKAPWE